MKNQFGGGIYALRRSRGLTQAQLGEIINVSETAISKWERGVTLPDIITLCNVADFFQVSLDEMLGRDKNGMHIHGKYTEEQMQGYEISLQLLKCCKAARQYGLLAMEECARKEHMDNFLVFCIQFILESMRKQMSIEQIFELLQNYMDAESENSHAKLTVIALKSIVSGENEEYLKELLASFLGRNLRDKLLQKDIPFMIEREAILNKYCGKVASASLLEELQICTDEQLRFILKNVDYEVIIHALVGASGNMCIKFLANLSDRMLNFIDEDIRECNVTSQQIMDAQRQVLRRAVEWKVIVPDDRRFLK